MDHTTSGRFVSPGTGVRKSTTSTITEQLQ